jgi:CARDB
MADNNQQVKEPELDERAQNAQKEFKVIVDVLKVPLRTDVSNQKLPPHRVWRGGCLLELQYPDLVPFNSDESAGPVGFCVREENMLIITVKNQGNARAPRSVTRVTFSPDVSPDVFFDLPTDPIEVGDSIRLEPLEIPVEQLDESGGFVFQIRVDVDDDVVESNEENNIASGTCEGDVA